MGAPKSFDGVWEGQQARKTSKFRIFGSILCGMSSARHKSSNELGE